MTINIVHHGMEITPAIRGYVEEKMESLEKYAGDIQHVDVEVGRSTNHHQKGDVFECKAVMSVGGRVIRIQKEEQDLYKAIDKVRDHLRAELSDAKERLGDKISKDTNDEVSL
ncbi:ribosome-associated translation inhibitor RaiA [Candidatus Uhrbacteria bacterium]|nr:ribosome-associated translation inhibitor RaiA [Candidatus Uhrbacteria bacterium]